MSDELFSSEAWQPALDKYELATGLAVELFDSQGQRVLGATGPTPLNGLFREFDFDPGLFADCAGRCLTQAAAPSEVAIVESRGLAVVGAALTLDGAAVGAAVAGYAITGFLQIEKAQRLTKATRVPFERFWAIAQQTSPLPKRRLILYGELLQVLGNALLRENHRTRLLEEALAAKDEFLAVLSHELRTPLAAILGWAAVLSKSQTPEHVHRAAETIARNARLQSRMVEDLLDVNRIGKGTLGLELKRLDLLGCLSAALEMLAEPIGRKALQVEVVGADEPLIIEADAGRLQQVFRNVLSNAVKFTPEGGSIRIAVSRQEERAQVMVADTGVGISPEFLPYVFDIFRQQEQGTRRWHEGLGIGLALVKRLVELQQGTVAVASAGVGQGTQLTVTFPLVETRPEIDLAPQQAVAEASSGPSIEGLSVLLVEDSEDSSESLRLLLEQCGAKIAVAHDGCEALEFIGSAAPDVVLCDLRMPRMDGYEFMRALDRRPSGAHPPVIAISGLASQADRSRTREAGFRAHISKPFSMTAIIGALAEAVPGARTAPASAA